jgi:hypothetical protein
MSFESRFDQRYEDIVRPAIEEEQIQGYGLKAYRVDNSKTGDSILTDIVDGIAHSRLVLADVSVVDEGRYTEVPIRNGNVMYEVGLALACRNPSEVLLVRDDSKKLLFDASTIPHLEIDFSDTASAVLTLRSEIADRLKETNLVRDARTKIASRALTQDEIRILRSLKDLDKGQARDFSLRDLGMLSYPNQRGIDGLLSKGAVRTAALRAESEIVFYALTPFGYALADFVEKDIPIVKPDEVVDESGSEGEAP